MATHVKAEPKELPLPQALIGWATLILVLLSVLALGANRPVAWTLLSMAILPLFILQIALDLFRGIPSKAALIWPWALLFIGAVTWGYMQTLPGLLPDLAHPVWALVPDAPATISADPLAGQHHVMRLAMYAMVFWIGLRAATSVDRGLLLLKAFAIFSTALAGFGLFAWFTGTNIILQDDASATVSASFINRNSYATFAAFGAIANLALYLRTTDELAYDDGNSGRRLRNFIESFYAGGWIFTLGLLLCFGAIILSQSRAGAAATIIGIVSYLAVSTRQDGGRNPLVFGTIITVILFVLVALSSGLLNRLLATSEEDGRFQVYGPIVDGIFERPLVGHGLGAFHDTFRDLVPLHVSNVEWDLAHSTYLENAYELGLPATFAFYLALLGVSAVILRGCLQRRRHRIFACVALGCIAAAAFHSVFDFSLQMPGTAACFAFLIGMGWAQSFRRERTRR